MGPHFDWISDTSLSAHLDVQTASIVFPWVGEAARQVLHLAEWISQLCPSWSSLPNATTITTGGGGGGSVGEEMSGGSPTVEGGNLWGSGWWASLFTLASHAVALLGLYPRPLHRTESFEHATTFLGAW